MNLRYLKAYLNGNRKHIPLFLFNLLSLPMYIYFKRYFRNETRGGQSLSIKKNNYKPLGRLEKIYDNCNLFDVVVIGSYADKTNEVYSDVDCVVLIKNDAFKSYSNFRKVKEKLDLLSREYQSIDPLQHHSHWIIFENELNKYEQSRMPLCTFENAVSLGKKITLNFKLDSHNTKKELSNILKLQITQFEKYLRKFYSEGLNLYELKEFSSSISLMPALYLQIGGNYIRKDVAIKEIKKRLKKDQQAVLDFSSDLRKNWVKLDYKRLYDKTRSLLASNRHVDRGTIEHISKNDSQRIFPSDLHFLKNRPGMEEFMNYLLFFKL